MLLKNQSALEVLASVDRMTVALLRTKTIDEQLPIEEWILGLLEILKESGYLMKVIEFTNRCLREACYLTNTPRESELFLRLYRISSWKFLGINVNPSIEKIARKNPQIKEILIKNSLMRHRRFGENVLPKSSLDRALSHVA